MSKIVDINEKKKDKPMSDKEIAEWAKKQVFKNRKAKDEPKDLVSGKTAPDGSFVHEDDDNDE
ncbi:hypothetical protein [Aliikangiella maris]|uniref:DUF3787 domain-containing protein n=2 Tax=Aliikangiella maris TaxID=3162458 RepID=A0ABV3MHM1_9GAMM